MSAYLVSKSHIDVLVRAAKDARSLLPQQFGCDLDFKRDRTEWDALGAMLWVENLCSVAYRYPSANDLPGLHDGTAPEEYRFSYSNAAQLSPVSVLKAIRGYAYQACEHPGWETSQAKRFCDALTEDMICKLPGYEEAAWEVTQ